MKRTLLLAWAVLLSVIAGVQTVMAQKVTLYSAGSKAYECDIALLDSIVFSEGQTIPDEEIVVTVDAYGNADGGHRFTRIDETTFLIDDLKYKYENGGLTVIGYDPVFFSGVAKIISKLIYNGRSMDVAGIGDKVFNNCTSLTSVIIPASVTSIGRLAFNNCTSLTSITIPSNVTNIDDYAFSGCSSLTSITIPEGVSTIGKYAFSYCSSLASINVEQGNETYDSRYNCNAIIETATNRLIAGCNNTVIPGNVTSIDDYAFSGCSSLTSITIPNSVTSIGDFAFSRCSGLTSVIIPKSVTRIGYYSFYGCSSLTNVYCYATTPPTTNDSFDTSYIKTNTTLHVPAGSVNAYKAADPWKNFKSIVAL